MILLILKKLTYPDAGRLFTVRRYVEGLSSFILAYAINILLIKIK